MKKNYANSNFHNLIGTKFTHTWHGDDLAGEKQKRFNRFMGIIAIPSVPIAYNNLFPNSWLKILIPDNHFFLEKGFGILKPYMFFFLGKCPLFPEFLETHIPPYQGRLQIENEGREVSVLSFCVKIDWIMFWKMYRSSTTQICSKCNTTPRTCI